MLSNDCFFAWVETELKEGRNVRLRVKGNSMFPLLRGGKDEVVLCPCRAEALRQMDVVLFRYLGRHVLHRIIAVRNGLFILQGDGVWAFHEECAASEVVGVVRQVCYASGKSLPVASRRWRWASRAWRGLGRCRRIAVPLWRRLADARLIRWRER